MRWDAILLSVFCGFAACGARVADETHAPAPASPRPAAPPHVTLSRAWPNITTVRPVQMVPVPNLQPSSKADAPTLWYLLEQRGTILLLESDKRDASDAPHVVDLRERVNSKMNEEGLLSLAFHPKFPERREVYVYYTAEPPKRSVLSRMRVSEDGRTIDPASEEILLEVSQPYWNHNGGTVLFGPDGYLYLSLGDGGAANDPHDNGQNMNSLLAKVLRIDVDHKEGDKPYAIPADNPFVGKEGARPEIWASGLRNVWRMSFDRATGDLWGGDVGQNSYEEIDLITKGGNYGWNRREGLHRFGRARDDDGSKTFVDPVVEYPRKDGISVTGGYVYRGDAIPGLEGAYVYADFQSGRIWAIRMVDGKATAPEEIAHARGSLISSFAEAPDGTLYILTFEEDQRPNSRGAVYQIVR